MSTNNIAATPPQIPAGIKNTGSAQSGNKGVAIAGSANAGGVASGDLEKQDAGDTAKNTLLGGTA